MYQAYDTLSDKMKNILDTVNGLYVGDQPLKLGNFSGAKSMKQQDPGKTKVHSHHPIIRTHPDSKNKALYIGGHAVEIEGMTKEESTPILNYLKAHSTRPEFICRFKWSPGAIAIWDNRCTQHYAVLRPILPIPIIPTVSSSRLRPKTLNHLPFLIKLSA